MDENPSGDCKMISQIIENDELFVISIHFLLTGNYQNNECSNWLML